VADGVDRADLAFEPAQLQLDVGPVDGERVELVGGAPGEPAVQLLQVRGAGVGVAVAGQERAGQTVQTKLESWVEDGHGDIGHNGAPGRGTRGQRPATTQDCPDQRGEPVRSPAAVAARFENRSYLPGLPLSGSRFAIAYPGMGPLDQYARRITTTLAASPPGDAAKEATTFG
jgi:hypothetical protein